MSNLNSPRSSRRSSRLKAIDAVCDQFEAHLQARQPLALEHYLRQVDATDREELLYELLHLQLGWEPPADWAKARESYTARFPQLSVQVKRAFNELQPATPGPATGAPALDPILLQRVQAEFGRSGLPGTPATDNTQIELHPANTPLSCEVAQLWSLVLRHAPRLVDGDTDQVAAAVAVVNELLDVFPERRRQILRSVLVGKSAPAIVKDFGTAPSTVSQTIAAAIEVLQAAARS